VQFYDDESFLATVVSEFLAAGVKQEQPLVVIATSPHRRAFVEKLRSAGVDTASLARSGRFVLLDARETLATFMVDSLPDPVAFRTALGDVIERSLSDSGTKKLRAYGEMVDVLWKDGNTEGAIQLEALWNDLANHYDFALLCAYSMGNFCRSTDAEAFRAVCEQHSHVAPTESLLQLGDPQQPRRLALLEHRERALEAEIVQRELLEQRLRETIIQLQEREVDLRDVVENAAEGIHLVTKEGVIQWANSAELAMLGYTASEYIGEPIAKFHVDQPVVEDMLLRLSCGETLREFEARLRHKDGSVRHVLVNSNVRWQNEEFVHTRCFSRDITAIRESAVERERLLEREQAARAEAEAARIEADRARSAAEQANRAKSDFLAVMSHELRTPLNAIGGHAELLELGIHGPLTESQREALDRIQRSQRMLLGLINQVLNYARIETGSARFELTDVPLDQTIRATEAMMIPQFRKRSLRYEYEGCSLETCVVADADKLQQILLNLLSNAVKFTERGGNVRVSIEPAGEDVCIHVADTGIGIPADKLSTIFDPFVQVDPNYTRRRDGIGLGLAISRDLARGMGGELTAVSTDGRGSTFTLRLRRPGGRDRP